MHYPLIDRHLLADLRLVHAFYNTTVMFLFFYHGTLGLAIRRARLAKAPLPFPKIKRHRKTGPALSLAGLLGFCIGLTLVLLDTGNIFEFPFHLAAGALIVVLLITTFIISRKIKGQDSPLRTPHMIIGAAILCCYSVEAFLGVGALL